MKALLASIAALTLGACASGVHSGYLRQGFEQSDFYLDAGGGPWWVTVAENQQGMLDVMALGEGRGRSIVVHITAKGETRGPVDFGFRPRFENSLHISSIEHVTRASEEEFSAAADKAAQKNTKTHE